MQEIELGLVDRLLGMIEVLDEKKQRRMLAFEAKALGRKGVKIVHEITGASPGRIRRGLEELKFKDSNNDGRIRKKGGGRKKKHKKLLNSNLKLKKE